MGDDYQERAARMNQAAKSAHKEWVASLTPSQRRNLEKLGVLDPAKDRHEVGGHSPHQISDVAETSIARDDTDPTATIDDPASLLADEFGLPLDVAEQLHAWHQQSCEAALRQREGDLLSIVIGGLISSKNIRISAAGLAFAAELDAVNGLGTQAAYARLLGVTRSSISKSVKAWRRSLQLRRSSHQKSDEACQTYSEVGKKNHWRRQTTTASRILKVFNPKSK